MKTAENAIEKATKFYQSSPEIRNSILQLPIIGATLDFLVSGIGKKFHENRFIQAIQILHEEMSLIDESKVDTQFLNSEEFFDIIVMVLENSVKTRHREKIRLNCSILAGSILTENEELRHSAEDLLILIRDLSRIDLRLAKEIYKQQENKPDNLNSEEDPNYNELHFVESSGWDELPNICKLDYGDFRLSLTKLSNAGLIKEIVATYSSYLGGEFIITSAFQRLVKLISYSNKPIFNFVL